MINKIKKYESVIYLAIFILGLYTDFLILEIAGIGLLTILGFREYIKFKNLKSFLTFLFIISVATAVILSRIIPDFSFKYTLLFYAILFVVSYLIKTLLSSKIRYNQKFWGVKPIGYILLVILIIILYYLVVSNFIL